LLSGGSLGCGALGCSLHGGGGGILGGDDGGAHGGGGCTVALGLLTLTLWICASCAAAMELSPSLLCDTTLRHVLSPFCAVHSALIAQRRRFARRLAGSLRTAANHVLRRTAANMSSLLLAVALLEIKSCHAGIIVFKITRKTYMRRWVAKLAKPPPWSGRGNLRLTQTVPYKF
jgi:hypothetical protein